MSGSYHFYLSKRDTCLAKMLLMKLSCNKNSLKDYKCVNLAENSHFKQNRTSGILLGPYHSHTRGATAMLFAQKVPSGSSKTVQVTDQRYDTLPSCGRPTSKMPEGQ